MGCCESQGGLEQERKEKPSGGVTKSAGGMGKKNNTSGVPKLYYFDQLYAKGEPIRFLLHYAGVKFEDVRLSWEEFGKMKKNGELPNGQVPLYVDE